MAMCIQQMDSGILFSLLLIAGLINAGVTTAKSFPFQDPGLDWGVRVKDLVGRLTVNEMMYQMAFGGGSAHGPAPAIPRLGILPYPWWEECLRGPSYAGRGITFPQSIGLAAAFNRTLVKRMARMTAVEVRAKFNDFRARKMYGDHTGISCFSPLINLMRHPFWGRNQETYGEDPYLTGQYGQNYVWGLQGDDPRYLIASATCKHIDAYGGPDNYPVTRFVFDAKDMDISPKGSEIVRQCDEALPSHLAKMSVPRLTDRDWRLTFLPAFKACLKAKPYGVMCSYNSINGVPSCANRKLLTDILRDEWGFDGYVVSDDGALRYVVEAHHYINNSVDAAAYAVKAGANLEVSSPPEPALFQHIEEAVNQGKLTVEELRQRVEPLFLVRMKVGEFDPPDMNPYSQYNMSLVLSPAHIQAAVEMASETFVLLKNKGNLLPLQKTRFQKIAIVGPMANNLAQLYGDYNADVDPKTAKTPLQGLSRIADKVAYAAGCVETPCTNYTAKDITTSVIGAQLVIICVGTGQDIDSEMKGRRDSSYCTVIVTVTQDIVSEMKDQRDINVSGYQKQLVNYALNTGQDIETEMKDRHDINLPGYQTQLVNDALNAVGFSAPVLLLVFSGAPVNISFADADPRVKAIMQCHFPALAAGDALFNTLTMATPVAAPSARLPYTWYKYADQIPAITDYSMKEVTYRYITSAPLYPFGYGLSYTKFEYSGLDIRKSIERGDNQIVMFNVTNVGKVDAYEVVQVYISWMTTKELMPNIQLVGFEKVFLRSGTRTHLEIDIDHEQMAVWTDTQGFVVEIGTIKLYVGGQQPYQFRDVGSNILEASFDIVEPEDQ